MLVALLLGAGAVSTQDPISPFSTAIISLGGFGLLLLLLLFGRLVTKSQYDELRADRDAWRAACEREQANNTDLREQVVAMLVEQGKTNTKFLEDLKEAATRRRS